MTIRIEKILTKIILLSVFIFIPHYLFSADIIKIVIVSASASNSFQQKPENIVNNSGLDTNTIGATHDSDSDATTMWQTPAGVRADTVWLEFNFGSIYAINEMYVWNFNQLNLSKRGLKNIKITYSTDGMTWDELPAPENVTYEQDVDYPFQLAKAGGLDAEDASNLNDDDHSPINFNGINARFVRIIASKNGNGNWGTMNDAYGLSEIKFTTNDPVDSIQKVYVDFNTQTTKAGNLLFGGAAFPSLQHRAGILPKMMDAGVNFARADFYIESIVPSNTTIDDYKNNVNDIQNPDTWNWGNMSWLESAKEYRMKTMAIVSYCPAWLSYNNKTSGIPKDFDIYADIVRKIYTRYYELIDFVEVYNEPGYFVDLAGSPYTSKGKAMADIYYCIANVVKEITPDKPVGGISVVTWSDGGVGGTTNRDFFADPRINHDNFNFYSHHIYTDYGIRTDEARITDVRELLKQFGYDDVPIYVTEWNMSISNAADDTYYYGEKSVLFVANCLMNWANDGLDGALHWVFLKLPQDNDGLEKKIGIDGHGMYTWDINEKQGILAQKVYVFKLMSRSLGLGDSTNLVFKSEASYNVSNIAGFINSKGEKSVMAVNSNSFDMEVEFVLNGVDTESTAAKYFQVSYTETGETPQDALMDISENIGSCRIILPANSVTGLIIE